MSELTAAGVHDPRSLGISRYVERLAGALGARGIAYVPATRPQSGAQTHLHLGNSSRRVAWQWPASHGRYLLTVHDVAPRDRRLLPAYRAVVYPLCVRRAAQIVVHSIHAADLLARLADLDIARIEVVPHPATASAVMPRSEARLALGLPAEGPPLAVLPGVIKSAKLVCEAVAAAEPLVDRGELELLLAGHVADELTGRYAIAHGARLLAAPDDERYAQAIAAADCVLVLRESSVGETNGPLLDAIGAGRAVVATRTGSIPEVARGSALLVEPSPAGIRRGLELICDPTERAARERLTSARAKELSWHASATRHAELLEEMAA